MSVSLPQAHLLDRLIVSDFDGTITREDSLKLLFREALGDFWLRLETDLEAGRVSERLALTEAVSAMRWSWEEAKDFVLERVRLDPSFLPFYRWTIEQRIPLLILSGGFRELIEALLEREGLKALSIQANSVQVVDRHWTLRSASEYRLCNRMLHCKCATMQAWPAREIVYVGDGHTDYCPAEKVSRIFARASLEKYCREKALQYESFESFESVQSQLSLVSEVVA